MTNESYRVLQSSTLYILHCHFTAALNDIDYYLTMVLNKFVSVQFVKSNSIKSYINVGMQFNTMYISSQLD